MPELPDYLADGFREVLADGDMTDASRIEKLERRVERLLALVSDALDDASGIRFRNTHPEVCADARNGLDLLVRTDMDGDIESIDFTGVGNEGGSVAELYWGKP